MVTLQVMKLDMEKSIRPVHNEFADLSDTNSNTLPFGELSAEDKAIEKKVRLMTDLFMLPLVVMVYLMNHIDRNNYAAAKLQGLVEDLGLSNEQYLIGLSILFVGYILTQVPSNLLMNKCSRPSYYLGFFVAVWGLISLLTSQVHGFGGLVACRFLLGFVEAPFFAGVVLQISNWYPKKELNFRMALFYAASLVAGAFGNLIAAGILAGLDGVRGLQAWQWLYVIEGTITLLFAILVVTILPDRPDNWALLTPEMRRVARLRLELDRAAHRTNSDGTEDAPVSSWQGVKMAFSDPSLYLLALAGHGAVGAAGIQNVYPSLLQTLGYNHVVTLLLVAPPYIFVAAYSAFHGVLCDRANDRFAWFMYPAPIAMVGCLMFMLTNPFASRYVSFFLQNFCFVMVGTVYAWCVDFIPGPAPKRAAALGFINSIANASSIWTPYLYKTGAPHFRVAMGVNIGLLCMSMCCGLLLQFVVRPWKQRAWQNSVAK